MTVIQHIWLWLGSKLFDHIDVYCPDRKEVIGVTFSSDEKYINKVANIK